MKTKIQQFIKDKRAYEAKIRGAWHPKPVGEYEEGLIHAYKFDADALQDIVNETPSTVDADKLHYVIGVISTVVISNLLTADTIREVLKDCLTALDGGEEE